MESPSPSPYWFPAKRYGWGWGLPNSWQGWAVFATFIVLVSLSAFAVPPSVDPFAFAASLVILSAGIIAICFVKGEPPRWRWGK